MQPATYLPSAAALALPPGKGQVQSATSNVNKMGILDTQLDTDTSHWTLDT